MKFGVMEGRSMYQREIGHIIVQILKNATGKGPSFVRVNLSENILIVDIKGALTAMERTLLKDSTGNLGLIRIIRKKIMESAMNEFVNQLQEVTHIADLNVNRCNIEIDYENDRLIMIFICNQFLPE
jgi:uncharacterized protein YbcI